MDSKAVRVMMAALAAALIAWGLCGCASIKPTERYPFPVMLDPVTEAKPHVHVK